MEPNTKNRFLTSAFIGFFAIGIFFLSSCAQGNTGLLLKINGQDSVTVGEYRMALRDAGVTDGSYETRKKVAMNLLHDHLKALSAVEAGIDRQDDIQRLLQQYENDILRNEARERFLLPKYFNDSTISFFHRHLGWFVESKNFVYRYKDNPRSKVTRSREEAQRFVDSLYGILNRANYDTLTFRYSEYIDRTTGRGNYQPDLLHFGSLPYEYEMVVFKASADTILPPIEIQGAFLIPWVLKIARDTAMKVPDLKEASTHFRKKIEMMDAGLLHKAYLQFTDSLIHSGFGRVIEASIDSFLAGIALNKPVDSLLAELPLGYQKQVLVEIKGETPITFADFIASFPSQYPLPKFTRDNLKENLTERLRDRLFLRSIVAEGYKHSDAFRYAYNKKKNALFIQRIQPSKITKPDSLPVEALRRYYEMHVNQFFTPANVRFQEVFSKAEEPLKAITELVNNGIAFEKAVDSVQRMEWKDAKGKKILIAPKPPVNAISDQDEPLASEAFRYEAGELSSIIRQKTGFSLIYVFEKKEPQRQSFDLVRKKVETMAMEDEIRRQETRWLNEMKKKYRIILYENRLQ